MTHDVTPLHSLSFAHNLNVRTTDEYLFSFLVRRSDLHPHHRRIILSFQVVWLLPMTQCCSALSQVRSKAVAALALAVTET